MIRIMRMLSVPVLVGILGLLVLAACSRGASDDELLAAVSKAQRGGSEEAQRFGEAQRIVVEREVIKEVPVVREVVVEKEVAKEVPVEVIVEKEVVKIVEVEKEVMREVAAAPVAAMPAVVAGPAEPPRGSDVALVAQRRIIVRTVNMGLVVADVSAALDGISELAQGVGGWLVSSDRSEKHRGSISIRVPADELDNTVLRLRELASEVESEVSTSQDVTDEYVDINARLKNLQATEEALLRLFDRAEKVEDALSVQVELTRIQGEIERLQGRIKFLEQTSAFSLINARLRLVPMDMSVDAGPDQTFSVGQVARFRASFRPPEGIEDFTFTWDFGDGTPTITGNRTAPTLEEDTRVTATLTHVYGDDRDSPFIVEFEISGVGDAGVAEGMDTNIATVTKVPTIEVFAGEHKTVKEGDEIEVVGSFTRPEGLRDLRFKWDFGDGSAPITGSLAGGVTRAIATHVYSDRRPVPFTATMTITAESDAGEVEASSSLAVLVTEAPGIEVFAGRDLTVKQDEEVELAGSFTRPEGVSDLRFKWDFGDGSAPVTGELLARDTNAVASHTYPDHRPFPFTATLTVTGRRDAREVESLSSISVLVEESQGWLLSGWSAGDNWKTATRALSAVGQGVGTFLIWLGVFSPAWIIGGAVVVFVVRRRRNRNLA